MRLATRFCSPVISYLQHSVQRRTQAIHNASKRSFSVSTSQRSAHDLWVYVPSKILGGIHGLGVPWWAAIPLAAITIRGVLGMCISGLDSHRRANMRILLFPLEKAQSINTERQQKLLGPYKVLPRDLKPPLQLRHNATLISLRSILNFGMLLATSEAIRVKLGLHQGLFGSALDFLRTTFGPAVKSGRDLSNPAITTPQDVPESTHTMYEQLASGSKDVSDIPLTSFDPTMLTEGLRFCTDLTVPDPTGTLPAVLLVLMLSNVVFNPGRASAKNWSEWRGTFDNKWDYFLATLAGLFWIFAGNIPAGLQWYFIWNIITSKSLSLLLYVIRPVPISLVAETNSRALMGQGMRRRA